MKIKNKKSLLLVIVLALSVTLLSACGGNTGDNGEQNSTDGQQYVFKLGHIDPVSHPHNKAMEKFAEIVNEKSDGAITIEVYPAGQLGTAPNLMQQLKLGTVEMFQGGVGWFGAYIPDYWLVASNFVYDNTEHNLAVMNGEIGDQLAERLLEEHGIRALTQGMVRNPRNLLTKEPVRSLEDLQGLKIRVPEMQNWMVPWEKLGANPTPMPLTETFLGLQQGVVDGVEHGYPQLLLNHYTDVAKYCSITEHQYETAGIFIAEDVFQKLPENLQQVLIDAAKEAEAYNNELQKQYVQDTKAEMEAAGVEFIEVDKEPWYEIGRKIMLEEVAPELNFTPGLLEKIWETEY